MVKESTGIPWCAARRGGVYSTSSCLAALSHLQAVVLQAMHPRLLSTPEPQSGRRPEEEGGSTPSVVCFPQPLAAPSQTVASHSVRA